MKYPWSAIPALPVLCGIVAGIGCAATACDIIPKAYTWISACCVAVAAMWLWWRGYNWVASLTFFVAIGMAVMLLQQPVSVPPSIYHEDGVLTGKVARVTQTDASTRYVLDDCFFDSLGLSGHRVELTVISVEKTLQPGDVVAAQGRLLPITQNSGIPYAPDRSRALKAQGISTLMVARPTEATFVRSEPSLLQRIGNAGSKAMYNAIIDAGFSDEATSFAIAILTGDGTLLDRAQRAEFRASGLAHILALSGLHVGIVASVVAFLLHLVRFLPAGRALYYFGVAAVVLLYGVGTGMSPSVARASVMLVMLCLTRWMERDDAPYNFLCLCVALLLVVNPMWLWSVGLQLSVAACLGIVWFGQQMKPICKKRPLLRLFSDLVGVPVVAMTATSMLAIVYFQALPVWFIPANIVASLLLPVLMVAMVFCAVFAAVGIHAGLLVWVVDFLYSMLAATVDFFATLPMAQVTGLSAQRWQIVLYLLVIMLIVVSVHRRSLALGFATLCSLVVLVTTFTVKAQAQGFEVHIPAGHTATDILIRHDTCTYILTDGDADHFRTLAEQCSHWTARVGSGEPVHLKGDFALKHAQRRGSLILFADRTLLVADSTVPIIPVPVNYLLVTGAFKANVVEAAETVKADMVFLSGAINGRRRSRYVRELQEAGIMVRDLAKEPFSYVITNE